MNIYDSNDFLKRNPPNTNYDSLYKKYSSYNDIHRIKSISTKKNKNFKKPNIVQL